MERLEWMARKDDLILSEDKKNLVEVRPHLDINQAVEFIQQLNKFIDWSFVWLVQNRDTIDVKIFQDIVAILQTNHTVLQNKVNDAVTNGYERKKSTKIS